MTSEFGWELTDAGGTRENEGAARGAWIARVSPGSSGEEAGVMAGDVIVQIERSSVRDVTHAVELLRERTSEGATNRVRRGPAKRWMSLPPPRSSG